MRAYYVGCGEVDITPPYRKLERHHADRLQSDCSSFFLSPGFLCILHTWGQTMQRYPDIHCVVPGCGLSPDHTRRILSHPRFFLPVKVLSSVFRDKFVDGLEQAYLANKISFYGKCQTLADREAFAAFLNTLSDQDWVVYAKPPFGGPEHVLQYLARYTHRVAISNHRIVSINESHVTFRWKDYAHNNQQHTMPLTCEEFCAASCSTYCRRVCPAFAISGGLPTADVENCFHFAGPYCIRNRLPHPRLMSRRSHIALAAVGRCA